jgi:hypothetical protein
MCGGEEKYIKSFRWVASRKYLEGSGSGFEN